MNDDINGNIIYVARHREEPFASVILRSEESNSFGSGQAPRRGDLKYRQEIATLHFVSLAMTFLNVTHFMFPLISVKDLTMKRKPAERSQILRSAQNDIGERLRMTLAKGSE